MSTPPANGPLVPLVRTLQIIVGVLVCGVLAFLAFAAMQRSRMVGPGPGTPLLSYLFLPIAAGGLIASWLVPPRVTTRALRDWLGKRPASAPRPSEDEERAALAPIYQAEVIVGAALNEGPAFLMVIAYLLEGSLLALASALVLLAFLAARFPTLSGLERWIEARRLGLEQLRQFGS